MNECLRIALNSIVELTTFSSRSFAGGFSPKETIYDEASAISSTEVPLKNNEFPQKPLDDGKKKKKDSPVVVDATPSTVNARAFTVCKFSFFLFFAAPTVHEHKSNVTSSTTEQTLTFAINQTSHKSDDAAQHHAIPDFKMISSNFTSFIDDLLHGNVLEETSTVLTTFALPSTTTTHAPTTTSPTSKPIKSIINDDDFIIKHLKAPTTAVKTTQGMTEIFSKHTSPTMNGLLKLAGCNIYGQMYHVGSVISELSNACLECKCLPDIGVGCSPKC